MPTYVFDDRLKCYIEHEEPPQELYIGLGYDKEKDSQSKHYRKFFDDELEEVEELMSTPSPFEKYEIKQGKSKDKGGGVFGFLKAEKKRSIEGSDG